MTWLKGVSLSMKTTLVTVQTTLEWRGKDCQIGASVKPGLSLKWNARWIVTANRESCTGTDSREPRRKHVKRIIYLQSQLAALRNTESQA